MKQTKETWTTTVCRVATVLLQRTQRRPLSGQLSCRLLPLLFLPLVWATSFQGTELLIKQAICKLMFGCFQISVAVLLLCHRRVFWFHCVPGRSTTRRRLAAAQLGGGRRVQGAAEGAGGGAEGTWGLVPLRLLSWAFLQSAFLLSSFKGVYFRSGGCEECLQPVHNLREEEQSLRVVLHCHRHVLCGCCHPLPKELYVFGAALHRAGGQLYSRPQLVQTLLFDELHGRHLQYAVRPHGAGWGCSDARAFSSEPWRQAWLEVIMHAETWWSHGQTLGKWWWSTGGLSYFVLVSTVELVHVSNEKTDIINPWVDGMDEWMKTVQLEVMKNQLVFQKHLRGWNKSSSKMHSLENKAQIFPYQSGPNCRLKVQSDLTFAPTTCWSNKLCTGSSACCSTPGSQS